MDKINEIIEWFKNINMNTIIDILIAILIFLLFKLFSGTLSYVVSKLFKIKEKNKSKLKQNALYRTLNIFFPLLGAYLGLRFLNLPQDITALITKVFRILVIITISIGLANCITPKSPLFKQIKIGDYIMAVRCNSAKTAEVVSIFLDRNKYPIAFENRVK